MCVFSYQTILMPRACFSFLHFQLHPETITKWTTVLWVHEWENKFKCSWEKSCGCAFHTWLFWHQTWSDHFWPQNWLARSERVKCFFHFGIIAPFCVCQAAKSRIFLNLLPNWTNPPLHRTCQKHAMWGMSAPDVGPRSGSSSSFPTWPKSFWETVHTSTHPQNQVSFSHEWWQKEKWKTAAMWMEVPIVNCAIAPHVTLHCKVLCCCQFVAVQHLANANSGAQCSCFSVMPHCECASNTVCVCTVHSGLVWRKKHVTLHSKKMICVCFWNECAFLVINEQVNEDDDCMVWPRSKCAKEKQVSAIVLCKQCWVWWGSAWGRWRSASACALDHRADFAAEPHIWKAHKWTAHANPEFTPNKHSSNKQLTNMMQFGCGVDCSAMVLKRFTIRFSVHLHARLCQRF